MELEEKEDLAQSAAGQLEYAPHGLYKKSANA
jgi:hypothetical protein